MKRFEIDYLTQRPLAELPKHEHKQPHIELGNFDGVSVRLMPSLSLQTGQETTHHVDVVAKNGRGYERSVRVTLPPGVWSEKEFCTVYKAKHLHTVIVQLSQAVSDLLAMQVEKVATARQLSGQPAPVAKLEKKG